MIRAHAAIGALQRVSTLKSPRKVFIGAATLCAIASVFSIGSARAASTTCAALALDAGISLSVGDKTISNIVCSGDVVGSDDVLINFGVNGPIYEFSSDIINGGTGPNTSGGIRYTIAINSDQAFNSIALTAAGINFVATKEIFEGEELLATLGVGQVKTFAANQFFQTLNIVDSWTVGSGEFASLEDVNNLFSQKPGRGPSEVPGPLPILGAGVAFGLSRKLRARIRSSSHPS